MISQHLALALGLRQEFFSLVVSMGLVCVGFFAALFGETRTLISEPIAPMTVNPSYR
ncbi:hypothetical protein VB711_19175 [Cronbergia sp. UHCC 0137]|uniref:hypothetical protein n=1 Tax=Cronbergia sp. UHCC 0137 TaxID=3110239 RepID=UPI002B211669|nr:hypothetical protein [Cronbergia sp. UHCC 0137]MEA5619950.1 hypothetical protein [Cronbergia sp. UHCC 0137]